MKSIISVLSTIAGISVGCVEFLTSGSVLTGIFFFVVGGVFWPVTVGIWVARGFLLPFLRAHGIL